MPLNVLNITFDANLATIAKDQQFSGAQQRQRDFAAKLNQFVILTPPNPSTGNAPAQLAPNLLVQPTRTFGRMAFLREAVQLGTQLALQHQINCLTASNTQLAGLVGYLLKRRLNIPLNLNVMADIVDNPHYLQEHRRNRVYNLLTKWLLKRADTIRVSTKWEQSRLEAYTSFPEVWRVPFYIDPSRFLAQQPTPLRDELLGDKFEHLVLFLGRLSTQKDPFTLLQAAQRVVARFPKARFLLVGKGPLNAPLAREIERLHIGENVSLYGAIAYDQVPALMKTADIFTITSLYEGTCMVLQEAAVSQKPIVATQFAGAIDLVEQGKHGYLAPVGDAAQIADHICHLLAHPDKRHAMGQAAKARTLTLFPKASMVDLYRQMWQATANKK